MIFSESPRVLAIGAHPDDIEIGAGLGPLAGKIWRIGLMGHTARPHNVERLLAALRSALAT